MLTVYCPALVTQYLQKYIILNQVIR